MGIFNEKTVSEVSKEGFKTRWNNKLKKIEIACDKESGNFNKDSCKLAMKDLGKEYGFKVYLDDD